MSTNISFNGVTYTIPAEGDSGWATSLSNYFIALSTGTLQRSGGSFTLTAELDFGNAYGLKGAYYKSSAANPSSAGILRLGNNESIGWRNAGNSADYLLKVNASNEFQFNGTKVLLSGSVVNADIDAAAAIAYSKLNLSGSIVNADVNASAAIAYSKLNLATSIVNADISGSAAIAYSKLNLSTSIVNADINASAAIALSKLAATTASRALVSDASGFVSASSVTSTELGYVSGVTSAIQTQLDAKAPSASPTLTTPSTDVITLDGQGSTPTSPSSGFYKMYVKDSTNKLTVLDSSGNETSVGAGGGGINLITNGDAESGTTGWATYADSGTRPVDGTGGSPNVTFTTSSTTPLYGANSFLFTKDAANRQGQGASFTFSVQPAHQAKVLNISFDYIVSSGTFVAGTSSTDSDIIVYIYDVTNSTLIEPSSIKLLSNSSSIADRFNASFQTSATGTSYRLILHCASTSASAYVVKFDNISVGPTAYANIQQVDFVGYVASNQALTANTTNIALTANKDTHGAWNGSQFTVPVAGNYIISGLINYTTSANHSLFVYKNGSQIQQAGVCNSTANITFSTLVPDLKVGDVISLRDNGSLTTSANTDSKIFFSRVVGASGISSSESGDGRVVAFRGTLSQSITGGAGAASLSLTTTYDSLGAFSTSTYTVNVAGKYRIGGYIKSGSVAWASTNVTYLAYSKSGAANVVIAQSVQGAYTASVMASGSDTIDCIVGDTIVFKGYSDVTNTTTGAMFIERIAGPNQIAASETISASYYCSTNQSATTSAPINYDTKEFDSHSCVSVGANWKFTSPAARIFEVNVYGGPTTSVSGQFVIYKNGSSLKGIGQYSGGAIGQGSTLVKLNAGDYIEIRPTASHTFTGGSLSSSSVAHISIVSVGL